MELINELGVLALSTRMQRVVDIIRRDVSRIYSELGFEFESKWFPVFHILYNKPGLSVIALADEIGYAHPSVIALVKEMEGKKLIRSFRDKRDGRKRLLKLTSKAIAMHEGMKPVWNNMRKTAAAIDHGKLLKAIEHAEELLLAESFYYRFHRINKTRV